MNKILWVLTAIAIVGTLGICISVWLNFDLLGAQPVDWAQTGQVGDFYGGVIGTVVAAMGFILIYKTFESQNKAQEQQHRQFEQSFAAQDIAQEKQRKEFEQSFDAQTKSQLLQSAEFEKSLALQQIALKNQGNEFLKSQIESRFFELTKLHRENLYAISYEKGAESLMDRKAIKLT